ncbi:MAG: hypothetical protein PHD82_12860 [Candidatus Riflebacteria bacterium]|jgi:hypothetical protein|nr:hypothetical protein [Candidatus Riflebacteria bacterium]
MNRIILVLVAIAVLFTSSSLSAAGEAMRDPNAALRYLTAIGYMPNITDNENSLLSAVNSLETFAALPANLKSVAGEALDFRIKKLLENAARCPDCNFMPDNSYDPTDITPPYKTLRKFARFLNAGAWKAIKSGAHEDGATLLVSVFRFGDGVENYGLLISYMIGHAIREVAVNSMKNFIAGDFRPEAKKIVTDYLKSLPRPAFPVKEGIAFEKTFGEKYLLSLENDPNGLAEIFKQAKGSAGSSAQSAATSSCVTNQRVIMGAIEMAMMDGIDLKNFADFNAIQEKLLHDKYIKSAFVCPQKGQYKVEPTEDQDFKVSCSCGADPNAPSAVEEKVQPVEDSELTAQTLEYISSGKFAKDRKEFFESQDKILAVDEMQKDALQTIAAIEKEYKKRDNLLISSFAPSFLKCFEKQLKLQEAIDNLIR